MNSLKTLPKRVHSCHKHSKSKGDHVSTHAPTIKCHEEVMSKLSSCTNEDCVGNSNSCLEQFYHQRKDQFKKVKTLTSKLKLHQSVSAPGSRLSGQRKDLHPKTVKSKSFPIVQPPNLEDSVDFIPVKLANERKQRPQKKVRHNLESRLGFNEKSSKPHRPTWDEILRNNIEVVNKSDKIETRKSLQPDNTCSNSDRSSTRSLKQGSIKTTNDCRPNDQNATRRASLKQKSECSKCTESPVSEKEGPIFQHINSSDPIKTLDFLIRQLRDGLLSQPQNNSLQNIIFDMENALLKISVDNKPQSNCPYDRDLDENEEPPTTIPVKSTSNSSHEKIRNKHVDILQLEQNLEKSCRYLQSLCIKQKENCSNHLREKEQLSLQLAESRRLLAVSKSKEKNYEVTIGELRLKLQEANTKIQHLEQKLHDVENKNATLKEENQSMTSMKESMKRVGVRLKQISSEKEKLQSKLSLKELEIEKLKVLLQVKTIQKNSLNQDNTLQLDKNELDEKHSEDHDLSIISLSTTTSWSERPGLMCSSQASSSPRHSPSPYNSWQHISSIMQQPTTAVDINRGIAVILQDLKKKSEQLEPLQLELQVPSSCSSWSERDKVVYSDGESESFSS